LKAALQRRFPEEVLPLFGQIEQGFTEGWQAIIIVVGYGRTALMAVGRKDHVDMMRLPVCLGMPNCVEAEVVATFRGPTL
jgi:hypothetical protein